MRRALADAKAAQAGTLGTQNQIDAPERALSYQLARLGVLKAPPRLDTSVVAETRCAGSNVMLTVHVTNKETVPVSAVAKSA